MTTNIIIIARNTPPGSKGVDFVKSEVARYLDETFKPARVTRREFDQCEITLPEADLVHFQLVTELELR
jgi:hypothetical protein